MMQALMANADAAPTADREFSRTERLLVRVEAYAAGETPALTARLLNRGGQAMADLPLHRADAGPGAIDLPLSSFAAGEYLIEINAKTSSGSAQQMVAFRVGR